MPIVVRGARTHNLKAIDVDIPDGAIVVITGPSGSGKSSLAFDTIFAEAERRYLEALSSDLRAQAMRLPRPDVDLVDGLPPAIAIAQGALARSSRSTIGTATEITDHLRVLYARVGEPHCPVCGDALRAETTQEVVDALLAEPAGTKVVVRAPVARGQAGDLRELLERLRKEGFVRAVVDEQPVDLGEVAALDRKRFPRAAHDLDVVVDRLVVKDGVRGRASDSIELARRLADGRVRLARERPDGSKDLTFHSERFACEKDDLQFPPIEPALFSFNSVASATTRVVGGACPTCEGLGVRARATERTLVPDPSRTLRQGAIVAWGAPSSVAYAVELKRLVDALGVDPDVPWSKLRERAAVLEGGKKKKAHEGVIAWVDARMSEDVAPTEAAEEEGALDDRALENLREEIPCADCGGTRLRREARAVTLNGRSIADVGALSLRDARAFLASVTVPDRLRPVARPLLDGALSRLDALLDVGLGHLALDRHTDALSAGEGERTRIAGQLAGGLRGVLYVLDEPSRGMHPSDVDRLDAILRRLRDRGSTVLLVEHDLELISRADHVIDIGPVAGTGGGRLLSTGAPTAIAGDERSVTGPWLSGARTLPRVARRTASGTLRARGITLRNLRGVDLDLPLQSLICVTGPSGSGKSTLILDALVPAVRAAIDGAPLPPHVRAIEGAFGLQRVVAIDQAPLGRSPRSTPATATGIMPKLREMFAALPEAKARGYKASRFSANVKGGRCEACLGEGSVRIEMRLLPDVRVPCPVCGGARYDRETLAVKWRGLSVADVLATDVDAAQRLFEAIPAIRERLDAMRSLGLGYLPLGQPATTLSGGEAQRVKLARELARPAAAGRRLGEQTLYVLDEPTAGLHPSDVAVLLDALVALRDQGSTVVVIEHDVALAARADHVVDLGPGPGDEGGRVVASGPPEEVARTSSPTAPFLARALA
ncbi:MAG: excinuclease ABC subunit UvrA [Deltaproteobacteria bacterium]|nr:excinuclease ABC subunit UvrA [Deltaproteobacteria bacterium]